MRNERRESPLCFSLERLQKGRESRTTRPASSFKTFGSQRMPGQPQRKIARLVGDFMLVLDPSPEAQDLELIGVGMSGKILGDAPGDSMHAARRRWESREHKTPMRFLIRERPRSGFP